MLLAAVRRRDEPDGSDCYERLRQTQGSALRQGKTIKADRVPVGDAAVHREPGSSPQKGLSEVAHAGATSGAASVAAFRATLRM